MKLTQLLDELADFLPPRPGQASPLSNQPEDVVDAMDRVIAQMEAAKRALGITNRLEPGPARKQHRSRIMSNMNRIRANLRRIEKMLETE